MFDTTEDIKIELKEDLIARLDTIAKNLEDGVTPAKVCRMIYEQIEELNKDIKKLKG